jgi:hypothetical protein
LNARPDHRRKATAAALRVLERRFEQSVAVKMLSPLAKRSFMY